MKRTLILFVLSLCLNSSYACTRALYTGADNMVITGRSMDWNEDMATDLWVFPQGMLRNGAAGPNSLQWQSKYGSLVASVYGIASADGVNEKGLVMNMLYLAESNYGRGTPGQKPMSITLWGQYMLDNFATVAEAVQDLTAQPLYIIPVTLQNGTPGQVHLALSDASGDSAIIEYVDGKQVIHHGKEYTVMTNSPIYSKQLALNEYWSEIGGSVFLPGTSRAADRFVRTYYYISNVPKQIDKAYIAAVPNQSYEAQAAAGVLSVMRTNSVPFGVKTPKEPNIAATIWRSVVDQKNKIYYFDSSTRPNTFWVSLDKLQFAKDASVMKLDLSQGQVYSGEVADKFKAAPAFQFLEAK